MDRVKYEHQNHEDVNQEAGLLWAAIIGESRVDRFWANFKKHPKSLFFGHADVTLVVETKTGVKFPIKVRGIAVKTIKGKPNIGMPSEEGKDDAGNGTGEHYDIVMPRSAALRRVVTTLIFADEAVQATIADAAVRAERESDGAEPAGEPEGAELGENNPFANGTGCEA